MRTGQHRRVQAHPRRQRLLQGRRKKSATPAHLRHRVQKQDRDGGLFQDARRSQEARPSQDRRGDGAVRLRRRIVGPGLPLWLPKGAAIVEELEKLAKETEFAAGYVRVKTPHIAREKMYLTQRPPAVLRGLHVPADGVEMDEESTRRCLRWRRHAARRTANWTNRGKTFAPGGLRDQECLDEEEQDLEALKAEKESPSARAGAAGAVILLPQGDELPASPRSLRRSRGVTATLPLRLAEYGTCYRYEQTGELVRPDARAFAAT